MIRIVNASECQFLHRRTTHAIALDIALGISATWAVPLLDYMLNSKDINLTELAELLPDTIAGSMRKNTIIMLLSQDFSYYKGKYNKKRNHSTTGVEAFVKVSMAITDYLDRYENIISSR